MPKWIVVLIGCLPLAETDKSSLLWWSLSILASRKLTFIWRLFLIYRFRFPQISFCLRFFFVQGFTRTTASSYWMSFICFLFPFPLFYTVSWFFFYFSIKPFFTFSYLSTLRHSFLPIITLFSKLFDFLTLWQTISIPFYVSFSRFLSFFPTISFYIYADFLYMP